MNIPIKYRIAIIMSAIWLIIIIGQTWSSYEGRVYIDIEHFLYIGLLPITIFWGILWIVDGTKKRKETK